MTTHDPKSIEGILMPILTDALQKLAEPSEAPLPSYQYEIDSTAIQKVLQETTLALLRQPDLWVYSNAENGSVPFTASESTFNRLSMSERSKLQAEITSNVFLPANFINSF